MSKLNKNIIWVIVIAGLLIMAQQGDKKTAGEAMERKLSTTAVQPGGTFTVKYSVLNFGSNPFFFSIKDTITGGCTVFGNNEIITTITSPQTETGAITVNAPQSGICTFSGDYKLGSNNPVVFPNMQVAVQSGCTSNNDCTQLNGACVQGICNIANGQCSPQNKANGAACPGGTCSNGACQLTTAMERILPTTASPSSTLSLKYKVTNPQPPYFFSIKDAMVGGCTVFGSNEIITTITSPQTETGAITVSTPASGTCQFDGNWKLGSYTEVNFASQSVSIQSSTGCTSSAQCSSFDSACKTGVCSSGSCSAQNKADGTSCSTGTCKSGVCESPKTCAQLAGNICTPGQLCSGGTMTSSSDPSNLCCAGGICHDTPTEEQTCEEIKGCEFWEACDKSESKCTTAPWVYLVGGFMGLMFLMNAIK